MNQVSDNQGISDFVQFVRDEAKEMDIIAEFPPTLGTISGTNLKIDGFSETIPPSGYMTMKNLSISSGDRVLCIPASGTIVIVGQVI